MRPVRVTYDDAGRAEKRESDWTLRVCIQSVLMYGDVGGAGVRRAGAELIGRWSTSGHGGPDVSDHKIEARGAL